MTGLLAAWHMGDLHPYEQALTVLLAFGPFVLLGGVLWWRRRTDAELQGGDPEASHPETVDPNSAVSDSAGASGQVGDADLVLGTQGVEHQVEDQGLELAAQERDVDRDVEGDRLGRHAR